VIVPKNLCLVLKVLYPNFDKICSEEIVTMQKKLFVFISVLLIAAFVLSGCTPKPTDVVKTEEPKPASSQVEVFSWWTGGGEAAGLEAMQKVFATKYPNIEFVNAAVAGGAGTNAKAVLATRLQAGG